VQPPPGWRPRASASGGHLGLVVQAVLLAVMVFACTTVGWLWVNARRPPRRTAHAVAAAPAQPARRPPAAPIIAAPPTLPTPPAPRAAPEPQRPDPAPAPSPPPAPEGVRLGYEKDVLPILRRSCTSCHGDRRKRGGLDLTTFAALRRGGDGGPGVQPGRPDDSPLYESIASGRMPPGRKKLTAAEKRLVHDWIAGGARSGAGR
jgi:hypothetical protein